jgi:23S rRNA (guanine2445-N2)-methyltransferase / 23S rRNA (guanine2069-N7)-methyltransferase
VIEAACMAADVAPGLLRDYWGFSGWLKHDRALWEKTLEEARARQTAGRAHKLVILGFDHDPKAILTAQQNARVAGIAPRVRFEHKSLDQNHSAGGLQHGLVVTNPPYGERLGNVETLGPLYVALGDWLKRECRDWKAGVIVGDRELGKQIGIRASKINSFYNGALECKLLQFDISPERFMHDTATATQ